MPWRQLVDAGAVFRKGQLGLVAAGPGTGKSAMIQTMAQVGDGEGTLASALYFSADTDASTFFKRSAAISTGYQMSDVDSMMLEGTDQGIEQAVIRDTAHMRADFRSSLSDQDVYDEIDAYAEVYGEYPELMVFDNLSNIYVQGFDDERQGINATCTMLHDIARETNSAVITLHHVTGIYEGEPKPVPMSGLINKVSKIPEVIFTLHRTGTVLNVSVVKNRNGHADASGNTFYGLPVDLGRMRVG
ncbi:AAA family ATPase [Brevibacterium album]|uniref:AAA family ATPase n=1 Tax=Brevibacterium album TaxID=417948 RepID=UPI00048E36E0|nr:AAA family ATPase [Brevibacterium album]